MTTALQPAPQDYRSTDVSAGLIPGNVHSMSSFPQDLTYTQFDMSDTQYPAPTVNGQRAASDSTPPPNPPYRWNSAPETENNPRKEPFDNQPSSQRPVQPVNSAPASAVTLLQDQAYELPTVDSPRAYPEPDNSTQTPQQAQGRARSPRALSPSRDYTIPRQSSNMGNYYPQSPTNVYPSHQTGPSTSSYNAAQIPIPVSPNPRAFAQQPTYITPPANVANLAYMRPQAPKEEVCLECAMRDQDMADIDVTGPGAWDRESDVYYADLVQREEESHRTGVPLPLDPHRPSALADLLTETNMKVHLAMVCLIFE